MPWPARPAPCCSSGRSRNRRTAAYWWSAEPRTLPRNDPGWCAGAGEGRRPGVRIHYGLLTRLLHERNRALAINALAAQACAAKVSACFSAACLRCALRRAERQTLSKPRFCAARRSPAGGYCTITRAISGLSRSVTTPGRVQSKTVGPFTDRAGVRRVRAPGLQSATTSK